MKEKAAALYELMKSQVTLEMLQNEDGNPAREIILRILEEFVSYPHRCYRCQCCVEEPIVFNGLVVCQACAEQIVKERPDVHLK
jgi:hypothetical protein